MSDRDYAVVYDVTQAGIGDAFVLPWLVIALFLLVVWLCARQRMNDRFKARFLMVCLAAWVSLGGLGVGNVLYQQWRCLAWARAGAFDVVAGQVSHFVPMPSSGHANESFAVGDQTFTYSDFDLSRGGFNNAASHGGPIREGLFVRVSHREGRMLKLEVRK